MGSIHNLHNKIMKLTKSKLKEMIKHTLDELAVQKTLKLGSDLEVEVMDDGSAVMKTRRGVVNLSPKNYKILRQSIKRGKLESVAESDLPITTRKGKTVTVVHKRSGKELVVVNKPQVIKKYKRMGYLVNESINEAGMFDDYYELNPAYMDKFIKNYKKLNSKNLVKKSGGNMYGFRKGEREAHWKYDDDYKLNYDIDKAKVLGLINFFNRAKKDHPWG